MKHYSKCCLIYFLCQIFLFSTSTSGQVDPNPNSPTPILLSQSGSTRALAKLAEQPSSNSEKNLKFETFGINSRVILYATNLDLVKTEGKNAFRIYAVDTKGRSYRFPVLDIRPHSKSESTYAITILIKNEIGQFRQPEDKGELLISLAWRGLISNTVKLKLGKDDLVKDKQAGDLPSTLKNLADKSEKNDTPTSEYAGYRWSGDRTRFLEQATFGPTAQLDQRLRRIGLRVWLAEQFETQYPHPANPYPNLELKSSLQDVGCPTYLPAEEKRVCDRDYYTMYPVQNWFFREALYGNAQLRHKVAWALSQIWVVSGIETQQARHMIEYHKVLSRNAFGNYRDLMYEMTLNPTMGNYLDMARNNAFNPNENYAREILQLFSIGLYQLNQDGTLILNENNQPIPTYTQVEVNNFTKIFTGWTFCYDGNSSICPNATPGIVNFIDPMWLETGGHNPHSKTLLNYPNAVNRNIPAGQDAYVDLNQALDNIFYHPNVAPFVSKILIQHLITSDPTPAYVERVSTVFNNNGSGVRGDLKSVIRSILLDPEARGDLKTDPNYGKLREPVQFMTNVLRHLNVRSADGNQQSDGVLSTYAKQMGQNPFYADTVFNYYPPGHTIPGTTYNAPEFWILTTSTTIARLNFSEKITFKRIFTEQDIPLGSSIDLSNLSQLAAADPSGNLLLDELDRRFMHSTMSPQMRNKILTAFQLVPLFNPDYRAKTAVYLLIGSYKYQIQR